MESSDILWKVNLMAYQSSIKLYFYFLGVLLMVFGIVAVLLMLPYYAREDLFLVPVCGYFTGVGIALFWWASYRERQKPERVVG